jgi:hypothetical protein
MERIYDGSSFKNQHPGKFYCLVKDDMTNSGFEYNLGFNKDLHFNQFDMTTGIFFTNKKNIFFLIQDNDYIYKVTIPNKAIVCAIKESNNMIDKYKASKIVLEYEVNLEDLRMKEYEISYKYCGQWSHGGSF